MFITKKLKKIIRMCFRIDIWLLLNLYNRRNWLKTIKIGNIILKYDPENTEIMRIVAACNSTINNNVQSESMMKKCFEIKAGGILYKILQILQESIDMDLVDYKYCYWGGHYNLGFIETKFRKKDKDTIYNYVTKIISSRNVSPDLIYKEKYFYEVIRSQYIQLLEITPNLVNFSKIEISKETLYLLTYQKIEGMHPNDYNEIYNIYKKLCSISYIDLNSLLPFVTKEKKNFINNTEENKKIFNNIKAKISKLKRYNYKEVLSLVLRLEYIILEKELYKKLDIKKHFSFCHNDFKNSNIIYSKANNNYYIIDWVSYGLGIKGYDLAYYFWISNFNFSEIYNVYLCKFDDNFTDDNIILNIFFCYTLLEFWFSYLNNGNCTKILNNCIKPAINYVEKLYTNIQD